MVVVWYNRQRKASMKKVRIFNRSDRPGWYVQWRENGRRFCRQCNTRREAELFQHQQYIKINSDIYTAHDVDWDLAVSEYLLKYTIRGLADTSRYEAEHSIKLFRDCIAVKSTRKLNQRSIDTYIHERQKHVSPWSVNKDLRALKAFVRWMVKRNYHPGGIEFVPVKTPAKKVKPLTGPQVQNLLISAREAGPTWYIRVLLSLATGLRKNDIETLNIIDIDFETHSIDTRSKKTSKIFLDRPLPDGIMNALTKYVAELPQGQVKLLADTNTHKKWKRIRGRAGLTDLRYQDLRVTFSSMLQQQGAPLSVAQQLLEHASPETTRKFYTSVDSALRGAVNKLPVDEWLK